MMMGLQGTSSLRRTLKALARVWPPVNPFQWLLPRGILGLGVLSVCVLAIWASVFPLDVLVHARGMVRVENHNMTVQHVEGGRLKQLLVREGQNVTKGQLLAVMDNSIVSQEFASSAAELASLQAREKRLEAEVAGSEYLPPKVADTDAARVTQTERDLFLSRQASLADAISVSKAQADQRLAQANEIRTRISDSQRETELIEKQVKMLEPFVARGSASESSLLQKRTELQRATGSLNEARARLPQVVAEEREYRVRAGQVKADFINDAQKQLTDTRARLSVEVAKADASGGRNADSRILSPVDGVIQRAFNLHEGSVIKAGGEIAEIAPSDVPLVAEVKISPEDRDKVWQDMPVRIRIEAFGNTYSDALSGKVAVISADALGDDRTGRYYQVTIKIDRNNIKKPIFAGMTVDSYLLAGKRTLAQYILKPLTSGVSMALSES